MKLSSRLGFYCTITAAAVCYFSSAATFAAGVIYQENFGGLATNNLNGSTVDIDQSGGFNTTWTAYSGYKQNGLMPSASVATGAFLPFVPTAGNQYTLTATFTGIGPVGTSAAWFALGFGKAMPTNVESSTGNRFIEAPTIGRAWTLIRANNPNFPTATTNANQVQLGNATTGTGATQSWPSTAPFNGGDFDVKIVLDTTPATWTADFFAKRPTDPTYVEVSAGATALLAQDIGAIGFTRTTGTLSGNITKFELDTTGSIFVPGDVNGDGVVNASDFNVIRDHLFSAGNRSQGDLTNDGVVDFVDFRAWKTAFEGSGAGSAASFDSLIPEPATASLALLAASSLALGRRRRNEFPRQVA
jgi:hypothetical protein